MTFLLCISFKKCYMSAMASQSTTPLHRQQFVPANNKTKHASKLRINGLLWEDPTVVDGFPHKGTFMWKYSHTVTSSCVLSINLGLHLPLTRSGQTVVRDNYLLISYLTRTHSMCIQHHKQSVYFYHRRFRCIVPRAEETYGTDIKSLSHTICWRVHASPVC